MPAPTQTLEPAVEQAELPAIRQTSDSLFLALILAFGGGFLGAYTCLIRGDITVHTQRGNLTRLAIHIAQNNWENALPYLCCIVFFLLGILLTVLIRHRFTLRPSRLHWRQVTVLVSAALLTAMGFLPQHHNLVALSFGAFVWGSQTETFLRVRRVDGEVVFSIGGLQNVARSLSVYSLHGARYVLFEGLTMLALVIVFFIGSLLASYSVELWQERAILVCSGILLITFIAMFSEGKSA
ncbi:MAG TPA: YoaK family protein [Candidatus Acidoferrum sp.]|nr:YoaK family protein [Candidatus Acidoferrum sp.]